LFFFIFEINYSYLSASIGLRLEALDAGSSQNTIPIITTEVNDQVIELVVITAVI